MRKRSNPTRITGLAVLVVCALFVLGITACAGGGDTDGGKAGDQTFEGTQFVPTDDAAGRITLSPNADEIAVSQIEGFSVTVVDANGAPVPNILVSCDSERGVAIIEPNTGSELTSSSGIMSGKIGCETPGSFQFGCRLAVGANKRQLVTILCTGDIPSGFAGFPGSAGGTLGGGVQVIDDAGPGGVDTDGIRVSGIVTEDINGDDSFQVDVFQQVDCDGEPDTNDPEPFSDTFLRVTVVNNTNSLINFDRISYSIPNSDGTGRTFQSSNLALLGAADAVAAVSPNGGQVTIRTLAFSVIGAGGFDKYFVNASSGNQGIGSIGFRNVRVTLSGTTALGERVQVTGTVTLSFAGYNFCGAG